MFACSRVADKHEKIYIVAPVKKKKKRIIYRCLRRILLNPIFGGAEMM